MHLGDDAERYALGELPLEDRPRIEAHLRECALCRRRVADAERVTWSLAGTLDAPLTIAPRRVRLELPRWASSALAAAFALAFFAQTYHAQTLAALETANGAALATLASSHFLHESFTSIAEPVTAKVIYARDGAWIYVVVVGSPTLRLARKDGDRHYDIGSTLENGSTTTLFVNHANHPGTLELFRGQDVIARATLTYPRE